MVEGELGIVGTIPSSQDLYLFKQGQSFQLLNLG